jgi:hypothetical protein
MCLKSFRRLFKKNNVKINEKQIKPEKNQKREQNMSHADNTYRGMLKKSLKMKSERNET